MYAVLLPIQLYVYRITCGCSLHQPAFVARIIDTNAFILSYDVVNQVTELTVPVLLI
jgi:hypothetical protein